MAKKIQIIDLFSGAGGLTEGFRGTSFDVLGHVEKEPAASQTLRLRDSYFYLASIHKSELYYKFLSKEISVAELLNHVPSTILDKTINQEINDQTLPLIFKNLDTKISNEHSAFGLIGGPPCQAYSTIGRATNALKKETDSRIYLYRYYIEFLKKYKPKFFVFENVKGLLSFKDIDGNYLFRRENGKLTGRMYHEFREAGYELDYRLINTKDYGIPQARERIIIFGTPANSYSQINSFFNNLENTKEKVITVKEALEDLPYLHAGQELNVYGSLPNDYIKKNFRKNSKISLTQNISRPNTNRDLQIYKLAVQAKMNGHNLNYSEIPQKYQTHKNLDKFLDRYKALSWNKPSHTIVAHIAKDGHHYIHPDIDQNRSLTVREAARLQGFPDDFYFETSRTQAFIQIGNAVPPILSKKIASVIETLFL